MRHTPTGGTSLFQPQPLAEAEMFRALSEFDSDRAELFLARCAVLVEGRTEKLTFPLVFDALGVDPDKEGILVFECGGKGNMPLFARICNACSVPYVVVHDRDAPRGVSPVESERIVNRQIREVAGSRRTVVLTPDFETVSGLKAGSSVDITISGLNYEVTYPGVTDKYGMYSAVFGETAPEGRYSVRVVGPGGTATGVFEILAGRAG